MEVEPVLQRIIPSRKMVAYAVLRSVFTLYVVYPVALLMLFRLPEQISWLGLFQNSHQCSGTLHRHWNACVQLYASHILMLVPSIGGLWLWGWSGYSKHTKCNISAAVLIAMMVVFKASVDHWQLYRPPPGLSLKGKVAVITGANRNIGLATALAVAERGANVVVTCRSLAKCQPVVDQIASFSGSAQAAIFDLSSLQSAATLA